MIDPISSDLLLSQTQKVDFTPPTLDVGAKDGVAPTGGADFKDVLSQLIGDVDKAQKEADLSMKKMASGDENTTIQDVVMKMEQADLSFQLMKSVRDKLLSAYKEVIKGQA